MTQANATSARLGTGYALGAACLFGLSTPLAKLLVADVEPWMLAGLLFLGGGLGLIPLYLWDRQRGVALPASAPWPPDWRWLLLGTLAGGILAPTLLNLGLTTTSASVAALLLNFESMFTAVMAWVVFREAWHWLVFWGIVAIVTGGILLSHAEHVQGHLSWGAIAVLATCLMWAIDSNATHQITHHNPMAIALFKSGGAGLLNVLMALVAGQSLPPAFLLVKVLVVGFLAYGLTMLFFVQALRHLGASRTGAFFGFAPFIGAVVGVVVLSEPVTGSMVVAALLMALGVGLCIKAS